MPIDPTTSLKAHGLQVTAQRLAVLRAISAQPHLTAVDVADGVRADIGTISRQSVYDTLAVLTEHRIIRSIQPAGSVARYEDRVGDNHHHFVCRGCDRVLDVDCATGEAPCLEPSDGHDFDLDEAEIVYWGTCADCRAADA